MKSAPDYMLAKTSISISKLKPLNNGFKKTLILQMNYAAARTSLKLSG